MKIILSNDFRAWLKGYKRAYKNRKKEKDLIENIENELKNYEIEVKDIFVKGEKNE